MTRLMDGRASGADDELAELWRLSALRSWSSILADYAVIGALAGLAYAASHPVVTGAVALLIARQQHALTILIHEGVHRRLFSSRRLNDSVCRWLLAAPLLLSYEGYRHAHLGHHRATMTPADPDFRFVSFFPVSRRRLVLSFLPDLLGVTYGYLIFHYARTWLAARGSAAKLVARAAWGAALNVAAFAAAAAAGRPELYVACWLAPLFCVLPLFLHLRGVCEHAGLRADPNPMKCTWTVINSAQGFFVAPHHINYHMEHHGYPAVPHFNLPRLHALLKRRGALPLENLCSSYGDVLRRIVRID